MSENVLSYCTKGLLGKNQHITLQAVCSSVSTLMQEEFPRSKLSDIENEIDTAVVLLLRDFPISVQVIISTSALILLCHF